MPRDTGKILRHVCNPIGPFLRRTCQCGEREELHNFKDMARGTDYENTRRMMPVPHVLREMAGHGSLVKRNQDSADLFCPKQDFRITRCKRRAVRIANPRGIDATTTPCVVTLNGPPNRSTQVLFENLRESHFILRDCCRALLRCAAAKFGNVR